MKFYLMMRQMRTVFNYARFRCSECERLGMMNKTQHDGEEPIECLKCGHKETVDLRMEEAVETITEL